jgi:hypothetical protein
MESSGGKSRPATVEQTGRKRVLPVTGQLVGAKRTQQGSRPRRFSSENSAGCDAEAVDKAEGSTRTRDGISESYFACSHLAFKHHSAARVKLRVNVFRVLLSGGGRNIQFSTLMMPGRS